MLWNLVGLSICAGRLQQCMLWHRILIGSTSMPLLHFGDCRPRKVIDQLGCLSKECPFHAKTLFCLSIYETESLFSFLLAFFLAKICSPGVSLDSVIASFCNALQAKRKLCSLQVGCNQTSIVETNAEQIHSVTSFSSITEVRTIKRTTRTVRKETVKSQWLSIIQLFE